MLDGGDQPYPQYQPLFLDRLALQHFQPEGRLPQEGTEQPFHPLYIVIHAQPVTFQVELGLAVGAGMHRFLANKTFHVGA